MSKKASNDANPAYRNIVNKIIEDIDDGTLSPGSPLPSVRKAAKEWGVSISTITRAYNELEKLGYVETHQGRGSYVSFLKGDILPRSSTWLAFYSYARQDDEFNNGFITRLREDIQREYQTQTGEELNIFQDSKDISFGMNWRKAIQEHLGRSVFFIPVLTPTYLKRPACIAELKTAIKQFESMGMRECIYPICLVSIDKALRSLNDDDLANTLNDIQQNRNLCTLRFESRNSSAYRKEVARIVADLIDRDEMLKEAQFKLLEASSAPVSAALHSSVADPLQAIADLESASKQLVPQTEDIGKSILAIGGIIDSHPIDANEPFARKVTMVKEIARELEGPGRTIAKQCREYGATIRKVDEGLDAVIYLNDIAGSGNTVGEMKKMNQQMSEIYSSTEQSFNQIRAFQNALEKLSGLSRDLREPCITIRLALDEVVNSQLFIKSWEEKTRAYLIRQS